MAFLRVSVVANSLQCRSDGPTPKGLHPTAQGKRSAALGSGPPVSKTLKGFYKAIQQLRCEPLQGLDLPIRIPRVALAALADPGLLSETPSGFCCIVFMDKAPRRRRGTPA